MRLEGWLLWALAALCTLPAPGFANHPPRFVTQHAASGSEIVLRLAEGAATPVGSLLLQLRGEDVDGDSLEFSVREPIGRELLLIKSTGSNTADVFLRRELDRETRAEYALVLTLTDGHLGSGHYVTRSLLILVDDINDNEPVFKHYQSTLRVREDSAPGILTTVEATDADEGPYGQVIYTLEELDGDNDLFTITPHNGKGVIRLVGKLDYERKYLYQVRVLAKDRANKGRVNTATAAILIKVEDVEDQPPEFVVAPSVTRVSEDTTPGHPVLQVKAVDGDRGINNRIAYKIINGSFGSFDIDSNTGIISTVGHLDRESSFNNGGAYTLEIMATEVSRAVMPPPWTSTQVTILVTDVNDEKPTFRSAVYVGEVNENAPASTPVTFLADTLAEVFDHDQGDNGTFQMFLDGDKGIFEVTPSKGINEATFLIRVKDPTRLDFEQITSLNFSLIAKEIVLNNPKYSIVPVTVFIRDMNDNFPEFSEPFYEVSVKENSGIGTTIARIQATDLDSGFFGTPGIRYTHIGGSIANFLILDPESGLVTIGQDGPTFDRELVASHYLTVEARDQLGRGNRNSVQLIINIEDLNDNAPLFVQSKYEARLLENSIEFDSPVILEARDLDLNGTANSQIQYKIVSGDPYGNFTIDLNHGILEPKTPLDFEKLPKDDSYMNPRLIQLGVRAIDLGEPSLYSDVAVRIYIHDINDHAPLFEHQQYHSAIPEDLPGGTSVLQVVSRDSDGSSPNNMVVYRIEKGAQDKFVIEADTGILRVAHGANLDPDRTNPRNTNYILTVIALDGGIGPDQLTAKVPVNITIVDVNNKPPIFREFNIVDVLENTQVGKYVYQVVADDPDEDSLLRYKIDPSRSEARNEEGALLKSGDYDYVGAFELNPVDGRLRVVKILDREKVELIRLAVEVEDRSAANSAQTATATLSVRVGDENDNSPRFSKTMYRKSITENSKHGTIIGHVVAEDPDKNRTLTYSLEGLKAITDLIHLDSDTGEIVVASKIDHEQFAWLNASVKATDSGIPPRSGYAELCIQVIDENDNNPYFILDFTNITVREDAPIGSEIIQIEARDADSGDYGKITYLLDRMSSQGKFQINPETGHLNVSDRLNREEQSSYLLVIEAWDNYQYGYASGESRNAFKQIGITIADVNDESPVLEPIYGCVTITEFHPMGEQVTLVKATDADDPSTPNGRVFFSFIGGTGLDLFKIENVDFSTGRVITAKSLKALYGNYTLLIRAQDQGTPSLSDTMELSVCVTDFNDNAPRFVNPLPNATITIPENATLGTLVVQVEAIDNDIGPNAAVRYRLRRDPAGHWKSFTVHELTGEVRLAQPLDREKQKTYQLRVAAYDLGIPTPLTSDIELTILVRNVNDHQPQFLTDEYHINFTEHAPPGSERKTLLGTVDLDDRDEMDPPVTVYYYIVGGNEEGNFELDSLIHEVTTIQALDRESVAQHELIVRATEDCNQPPEMVDEFDPNDDTLLKVIIDVLDINDNAPRFIKRIFTGGVTTDADFGSQFMQIKAIDLDSEENAQISYYQVGPIRKTLTEGLEWLEKPPFVVDRQTGDVSLNFDPQKGMKGYFDFKVLANDTGGLHDLAHVFIYLLREDQRVRFVLRQHPSEVRHRIDTFREILGNVTNAIVNIDDFKIHENKDGSVDKTKTDLYLHLVNYQNNSIMEVPDVLRLVDQNIELLDTLFKDFNVLDTQPAAITGANLTNPDEQLVMCLVGSTIFLGLLLVASLAVCLAQRTRYQRQLKAATVTAFGSNESDLHRVAGQVPNTNMHSVEGSNPIWMQAYENEWYKHSDSLSQTSERDSLDENAVVNDNTSQNPSQITKPAFGPPNSIYNNSCQRSGILSISDATSNFKEQNDLNRNGMNYHQNLHQHLDKLSNPLITKKLETTEL